MCICLYGCNTGEIMIKNNIQLEDLETLKRWHEEFFREENLDKTFIPNCIYSYEEITKEIFRRYIQKAMENK